MQLYLGIWLNPGREIPQNERYQYIDLPIASRLEGAIVVQQWRQVGFKEVEGTIYPWHSIFCARIWEKK